MNGSQSRLGATKSRLLCSACSAVKVKTQPDRGGDWRPGWKLQKILGPREISGNMQDTCINPFCRWSGQWKLISTSNSQISKWWAIFVSFFNDFPKRMTMKIIMNVRGLSELTETQSWLWGQKCRVMWGGLRRVQLGWSIPDEGLGRKNELAIQRSDWMDTWLLLWLWITQIVVNAGRYGP